MISYDIDEFKKIATNYCIRFGLSLWSAISCQRKWLKIAKKKKQKETTKRKVEVNRAIERKRISKLLR